MSSYTQYNAIQRYSEPEIISLQRHHARCTTIPTIYNSHNITNICMAIDMIMKFFRIFEKIVGKYALVLMNYLGICLVFKKC